MLPTFSDFSKKKQPTPTSNIPKQNHHFPICVALNHDGQGGGRAVTETIPHPGNREPVWGSIHRSLGST